MEEEELVLESSMNVAAAEVVDAMAVAPTATGSGWLCVPSYVVTRIDMSSRHRCTCTRAIDDAITNQSMQWNLVESLHDMR
jgi:hypothetical protein